MSGYRAEYIATICSCPGRGTNRPWDCTCLDPPCLFCDEPLLLDTFEVHHLDHDRTNDALQNLAGAHRGCHRKHHMSPDAEPEPESMRIMRRLHYEVLYTFHTVGMAPPRFARKVEEAVREAAAYSGRDPAELLGEPYVREAVEVFDRSRRTGN